MLCAADSDLHGMTSEPDSDVLMSFRFVAPTNLISSYTEPRIACRDCFRRNLIQPRYPVHHEDLFKMLCDLLRHATKTNHVFPVRGGVISTFQSTTTYQDFSVDLERTPQILARGMDKLYTRPAPNGSAFACTDAI